MLLLEQPELEHGKVRRRDGRHDRAPPLPTCSKRHRRGWARRSVRQRALLPNPTQAVADRDGAGAAFDFDDFEPATRTAPGEVERLRLSRTVNGTAKLAWDGVVGAAAYDVLRRPVTSDFVVSATCIESGGAAHGATRSRDVRRSSGSRVLPVLASARRVGGRVTEMELTARSGSRQPRSHLQPSRCLTLTIE